MYRNAGVDTELQAGLTLSVSTPHRVCYSDFSGLYRKKGIGITPGRAITPYEPLNTKLYLAHSPNSGLGLGGSAPKRFRNLGSVAFRGSGISGEGLNVQDL